MTAAPAPYNSIASAQETSSAKYPQTLQDRLPDDDQAARAPEDLSGPDIERKTVKETEPSRERSNHATRHAQGEFAYRILVNFASRFTENSSLKTAVGADPN
jgi:hypothetical protein